MATESTERATLRSLPDLIDAGYAAAALAKSTAQGPHIPEKRALIHGDNLGVLAALAARDSPVDLIYVDPPFASGSDYRVVPRRGSVSPGGFRDTFPVRDYVAMLAPRLILMREVLASTGSIYVHVDWHASHWVRVLMDEIFGSENFCNEIAWLYGLGGSSPRRWPRKHDTIFWYSASPDGQWFSPPMVPATSARMRGQLKKAPDYWDIPSLNNQAHERTGYPTQKPVALLTRIIESSCPPDGLVADFFAGSGTTAAAAEATGRRWIAVDAGSAAIDMSSARLGVPAVEWDARAAQATLPQYETITQRER